MMEQSRRDRPEVLITGGSSGIGLQIASTFFERGWLVTVVGRRPSRTYTNIKLDLSCPSEVEEWVNSFDFSGFTTIINCAGVIHSAPLDGIDMIRAKEVFEVNYFSALSLTRGFAACHKDNRRDDKIKYVINVASIAGLVAKRNSSIYASSKFALKGLTRSLAVELAPLNILVNSVSPGPTDTPMLRSTLSPDVVTEIIETSPLKRLSSVSTIAGAVYFLGSEGNSCITGQDLVVDSGLSIV